MSLPPVRAEVTSRTWGRARRALLTLVCLALVALTLPSTAYALTPGPGAPTASATPTPTNATPTSASSASAAPSAKSTPRATATSHPTSTPDSAPTPTPAVTPSRASAQTPTSSSTPSSTPTPSRAAAAAPVSDLDVALVLTAGATAGERLSYRVTVTNHGPDLARDVVAVDVLPYGLVGLGDGLPVASVSPACAYQPRDTPAHPDQVRCAWPELAVGASVVADLTVRVDPRYPRMAYSLVDTVTARSSSTDPSPAQSSLETPVNRSADLEVSVAQTSVGAPVAGEAVSWRMTVRNAGPSYAYEVALSTNEIGATLRGADLRLDGVPHDLWDYCRQSESGVSCYDLGLDVGGTVTIDLQATVRPDATSLALDAYAIAHGTRDPVPANSAKLTIPVTRSAALDVHIVNPGTAVAGQGTTWQVTVYNGGAAPARDVKLTLALPDTVEPVSASSDSTARPCADPLSCTLGTVGVGQIVVVTFVGRVDQAYRGASVTARVHVRSSTPDPGPAGQTIVSVTPASRESNLWLNEKGPTLVAPGQRVSWTFIVGSRGPSDAVATVDVHVPGIFLDATGSGPGGTCTRSGLVLTCPAGRVVDGARATVTITGRIYSATTVTRLEGSATLRSDTPTSYGEQSVSWGADIGPGADLAVSVQPDPALFYGGYPIVLAGDPVSWTITVDNLGGSTAAGVVVTQPVPDGVSDLKFDSGARCSVTKQVLTCAIDAVRVGVPAAVVVHARTSPAARANLYLPATVRSSTVDPYPANNAARADVYVHAETDLSVTDTVTSGPVVGSLIEYTFVVHNTGPSTAFNVVLTAIVSGPVDLGWASYSGTGIVCATTDHELRCTATALAPGADLEVELTGFVSQGSTGQLVSTAAVVSDTLDYQRDNDTASAIATPTEVADLGVSLTGPASVVAGERATWTARVTNDGPSDARAVTLVGVLPKGLLGVQVTSLPGTCTGALTCDLGPLEAHSTMTVTFSARLASSYPASAVAAIVRVSSSANDPRPANNRASSTSTVTRLGDLATTLTSNPVGLTPGGSSTYTVRVANAGPSVARNLVVTDVLPVGLALRGAPSVIGGTCSVAAATTRCSVTALAVGKHVDVTIPVRLAAGYSAATVSNTASVTSSTPTEHPAHRVATLLSPVTPR